MHLPSSITGIATAIWQQRSRRERAMIAGAAVFAALALTYSLLIAPALQGRERLQHNIPTLQHQAAELQQLLVSAPAQQSAVAQPTAPLLQSDLDAMLPRFGLTAKRSAAGPDGVSLEFSAVRFSSLLELLAELHKAGRLQVAEARIRPTDKPGLVDATINLVREKGA